MLEIIAETLEDALAIEKGGGERIELVSSLSEGGLTPSYGMVKTILNEVHIPVNVMIRPHSKSFQYSREDIRVMKEDARIFQEIGVTHLVLGILDYEGLPCISSMDDILEDTSFTVTFHRAIDESTDLMKSLERLEEYKRVTHVLTSGGPGKAQDHLEKLKQMIKASQSVKVIAASGIHHDNFRAIKNELSFHLEDPANEIDFDLHVGTAVRGHKASNPVSLKEVKALVNIYRENGSKEKW